MATIERPKKEKTKKPKVKQRKDVLPDIDEVAENVEKLTTSDISCAVGATVLKETPNLKELSQFDKATTPSSDIVSRECFIASDFKDPDEEETSAYKIREDNQDQDSSENVSLHDELVQATAASREFKTPEVDAPSTSKDLLQSAINCTIPEPSAPSAPTSSVNVVPVPAPIIIQYPNLSPLQLEQKSKIIIQPAKDRSPSVVGLANSNQPKRFTAEQLKEIYFCPELDLVKQFELEFLMNSLLETYESDPLYAAVMEYYNLQSKLKMNMLDAKIYRKDAIDAQGHIWKEVPITKTFSTLCADYVEVKETVTYNIAQVDGKNLESTSAALKRLYDLICFSYSTNLITAKITKVKIDQIINDFVSHPVAWLLPEEPSICLQSNLSPASLECMAQLRRAIMILFNFTRKLNPSKDFEKDVKAWLRKLISLHLLIATKEDHWFLLFNILRCPSGVGNWATEYLQIPCTPKNGASQRPVGSRGSELPLPLNSEEMNHCIAVLKILLQPVKKRNDYLKDFTQSHKEISDPVKEERWILVDSDGEDSQTPSGEWVGLKESDLIALLDQIPFEKLFASALCIEKFLDDYIIESDIITSQQMVKMLAFFTNLIEIFGEGMLTYNTERYKQLAKRLGRLIRHTLQYASDYNELFLTNNLTKTEISLQRIAVEMNSLLLRACNYIYRARNLATWQYYSSLPFASLDSETIWQIFYFLNVGFPNDLPDAREDYQELFNAPDFWSKFNGANADSSPEDLYYLLQAFFELANARDRIKDWDLIKAVCLHIFYIGFINEATREMCYKASRDMLVNLTLAYEDLMSCLLVQLKIRFGEIENASYLFKSLPVENWKPGMDSFEILSTWLLHFDFKSQENMLARIIISHLNWGFDCDGRLFLPHNIHVRMACLVTEALTKHASEVVGASGIGESVRQVSNLLDFTQSTKEQFTNWCWSMVSLLRLHLMDQSVESVKRSLRNPTEPLMFVPDLERIEPIYQGVNENRPIALYAALMVSLHGHSIPLICQKGFDLMKLMLNDYRHVAVIRCLELIVPLFLDTPDTLANCEKFHSILNGLLNADKTYIKMAKDIMYPNSIGPVLELLDNMIHHQITSYPDYGLHSPLNLINVWLNCLTSLPNWQNTSVVHLLDKILRVAYQFPDARLQAVEFFSNYFKDCDDWKGANKVSSSLKSFFGGSQSRVPQLSPAQGWLALVLLEIEFNMQDSQFWAEFLRQLAGASAKANVEAVLKKTASVVKTQAFPAHLLVIYKYANLIATMDISHPVFPVMSQKFFELYLSRVTSYQDELNFQTVYGVSDKFYEFNVPLMKKIKNNLRSAESFYTNEATKRADDEAHSHFYRDCSKIMKTYVLWLEDTAINKFSKDDRTFSPQYNSEKLREILNGNTTHWTEFIYLPAIRVEQRYQADQWARKCLRVRNTNRLRSPIQPKARGTPAERIKLQLSSYDKRMPAPTYQRPSVTRQNEITHKTLQEIKEKLKVLSQTATKFHFTTSELNSLNRNYLDTVQTLYKMVPYNEEKIKSCNSLVFNRKCTGPARITVTLESIRKDETVQQKIDHYRERHDKIIDELLDLNVEDFARCVEELGAVIRLLIALAQSPEAMNNEIISGTGTSFFYAIIEHMSDVTMKFTPTNEFFTQILHELGIFIQMHQEKEGLAILELALKRPDLLKALSGVFVPFRTRPEYFLKMYKFLIDSHLKRCDTKILFVLFSKFDLLVWLEAQQPKLFDVNQLLQLVLKGLESWSQPDFSLLEDQFRRHVVHIFEYDFPQHYGEVMQLVLDRISDQRLQPVILLDLLNSLLAQFSCELMNMLCTDEQIQEMSVDFARRQKLFNLKAATDTVHLFACHFQKERLHHGLHGLYPKHKDYCRVLSMWFSCFGHTVVVMAICTYQSLLADQISDIVFGSIIEMYSPWLIVYTEQTLQQQPTANWIRQLTDKGKMLYPWSEQHAANSKIIIKPFINTLLYILDNLPASHKILDHTFGWYVHHYAVPNIESHVYGPIHEGMASLPWEKFKPQTNYIDLLYDSLQKFTPECHAMLGHIFIRINWKMWFAEVLPAIPVNGHSHVVSRLFTIFIKIAFEPNIHMNINTSKVLEEAVNYPWHLVDYAELENLFKWFVSTVSPSIVLKMPSETNYTDRAVLDLLCLTSAMKPEFPMFQSISNATAKRILYTRSSVRLMRICCTKNQKLLASKDGKKVFADAFRDLMDTMNRSLTALATTKILVEQKREALNLMIEILLPMQTQSEETSNLHIDVLIDWQQQCEGGNLLVLQTLEAIGHMKAFIAGIYNLLEATIANYWRTSEVTADWHNPSWVGLLQSVPLSLDKLEMMPIVRGPNFLTLHIFILHKLEKIENSGDKITFLQDLSQVIENLKTTHLTESRLAIVWGIIISRGCKILSQTEHAKKPLLMLARHLHVISTQAEGWSDGLLGVMGLRKDVITNKRKVLTRCLACVIFSLLPDTCSPEPRPNQEFVNSLQELTTLLANKKFTDVKSLIVKAINIIKDNQMPALRDVPHLICRLIGLFYQNAFLTTIPEIWDFDFKLS